MFVTFSYMCIMIIFKWLENWEGKENLAPSIITIMINIPLKSGNPGDLPLWGDGSS